MRQRSARTGAGNRRAAPLPPDARRAAILDAVVPLLRSRGWSLTTKDIAAAAGVADGTIFSVFKDKEELLLAALETALDPRPTLSRLAQIDPSLPLEARLEEAVAILQRISSELWQVSAIRQRGRVQMKMSVDDLLEDAIEPLFEASSHELSVEPAVAAKALLALTLGGANDYLFEKPLAASDLVSLILRGIRRSPTQSATSGDTPNAGRSRHGDRTETDLMGRMRLLPSRRIVS